MGVARTLRRRLREDTSPAHQRVDTVLSQYDLADPMDLATFLQIHFVVFDRLSGSAGRTAAVFGDLLAALRADLIILDMPLADLHDPVDLHPIAVDYVVLGSRLGTQVLRKFWQKSENALARRADQYFGLPNDPAAWQQFCKDLDARPDTGPEADRVVADTDVIFDLFLDEALKRSPRRAAFAHA